MSEVKTTVTPAGFLNVNKPAGITSHDVVARLRKWTRIKRIGHAGTLDPDATGVLPIAIGSACRLISHLPQGNKIYLAEILLGTKTSTDDISGIVLEQKKLTGCITQENISTTIKDFIGTSEQTPPLYSAIKYKGQRLYQLARAKDFASNDSDVQLVSKLSGKLTEMLSAIKQRTINIDRIDLLNVQLPVITLRIVCSAGTYIRSLARDLGEALGCGACLKSLCREQSNSFTIDQSTDIAIIESRIKAGELSELLISLDKALDLEKIELGRDAAITISKGQYAELDTVLKADQIDDFSSTQKWLAVYKNEVDGRTAIIPIALVEIQENEQIKPFMVFMHANELLI